MDFGFQQPATQGPGFQSLAGSSAPTSSSYGTFMSSPDPYSGFVPGPEVQGFSIPLYGESFNGHSVLPNMDHTVSGYSNLPLGTNGSLANTANLLNYGPPPFISFNTFRELRRQNPDYRLPEIPLPPVGSSNPYHYYFPGATQPNPFGQVQGWATPTGLSTPLAQEGIPLPPSYNPAPTNMRAGTGSAALAASSAAALRQIRSPSVFPQSGASTGSATQRRHHRTSSLASAPTSTLGHHRVRSSAQSSRISTRPTTISTPNTSPPLPPPPQQQHASSQAQESQASGVTFIRTPAVTRAAERSEHQPSQPTTQQEILQRVGQLRAVLRTLPPGNPRVSPLQEELHSLVLKLKCGKLDMPQERRPEPKENDELTVNLECKICMCQLVDTVLLPCGHAILCRWCADQIIPSSKGFPKGKALCPMCRDTVKQKYRIYFP